VNYKSCMNIHMNELHGVGICHNISFGIFLNSKIEIENDFKWDPIFVFNYMGFKIFVFINSVMFMFMCVGCT
jgi:hypothetical protein